MNLGDLLKGLRLNRIRNVIIYTSFVGLILSLLFPMTVDNNLVIKISIVFLIYGIYLWLLEYLANGLSAVDERNDEFQLLLVVVWVILSIIGFLKAFKISFGINILDLLR